ncbi:MAG TPA: BlaI/MecI/CopY family transcriptional regulator [Vicinamibacterales bacterium]|jgi:predicted transcriptional regulator
MRPKSSTLTPNELELMKIVWAHAGGVTVRDVYEALRARRAIAYTTVMTSLKTLEQKGYLKTSQEERAFVYKPAQPKHTVIKALVRDFVDRVFNGSGRPLVVHLLENDKLSDAELRDIVKMMGKRK